MHLVVGLGGNLGDVAASFARARVALAAGARVLAASRLIRTAPVPAGQPEFLNAALLLEPRCDLCELLRRCQEIEREAGRDRSGEPRWGARVLDLDLLLASNAVVRSPQLELPHPRLHERPFALVPAAELVPDWVHPLVGRAIGELAREAMRRDPEAVLGVVDSPLWPHPASR